MRKKKGPIPEHFNTDEEAGKFWDTHSAADYWDDVEETEMEFDIKQRKPMQKTQCNFCGSDRYEERRIEYLYSHKGEYLLVPNTPVEVCLNCGMVYYDAVVLKEIERRFFAIQRKDEEPERYIEMPAKAYA